MCNQIARKVFFNQSHTTKVAPVGPEVSIMFLIKYPTYFIRRHEILSLNLFWERISMSALALGNRLLIISKAHCNMLMQRSPMCFEGDIADAVS